MTKLSDTVLQDLPCGCTVAGIGTLPDPVRPILCPLHTTAEELLIVAKHAVTYMETARIDRDGSYATRIHRLRAAIAKAEERTEAA